MTGKSILNIQPLRRIRQNHALEHATLQVLAGKHPKLVLAGYSDASGFWILGDVETGELLKAVEEARQRMLAGEKDWRHTRTAAPILPYPDWWQAPQPGQPCCRPPH